MRKRRQRQLLWFASWFNSDALVRIVLLWPQLRRSMFRNETGREARKQWAAFTFRRLWNSSGSQWEAAINRETPWVQRRRIHFQGGRHSNRVLFVTPSKWSFIRLEISVDYHLRKEMLSSLPSEDNWVCLKQKQTLAILRACWPSCTASFCFWFLGLGGSQSIRGFYSHTCSTPSFILFPSCFLEPWPPNSRPLDSHPLLVSFNRLTFARSLISSQWSPKCSGLSVEPDSWRSSLLSWAWWPEPVTPALHIRD